MKNNKEIQLNPSENGEACQANGKNEDIECQCDECEHYLKCYPEYVKSMEEINE